MRTLILLLCLGLSGLAADDRAGFRVEASARLRSRPPLTADGGHTAGTVVLELNVGAPGDVTSARVLGGPAELAEPALAAVLAWKFEASASDYVEQVRIHWAGKAVPGQERQRLRVGGKVQESNLVHKVTPEYPAEAKAARVQGAVRFAAIIDREGDVANLQLTSGHPLLVDAALRAVKRWRYKPTLVNGVPVEVVTTIEVNFELE